MVLLYGALTVAASQTPQVGQPAPNFKVITTTGQPVTLENYRNHVLIIDFFATWCVPCRSSIPHLVEMQRKYGKQGLQILGLSADKGSEAAVRSFATEHSINYPIALASDSTLADFGIMAVPVMLVVDKKGRVAEIQRGFSHEIGRSFEQLVKKLLAEK